MDTQRLFATVILAETLLLQLYVFKVWSGEMLFVWLNRLAIVKTLSPTILLLLAVIKVQCMVRKLRNKAIFQKEKVIMLHTVLFSLYFIFYTLQIVFYNKLAGENISL